MRRLPYNQLLIGDARQVLATLPSESVDCVITSPPYFRLRNYQDERQIGLEIVTLKCLWLVRLCRIARFLRQSKHGHRT